MDSRKYNGVTKDTQSIKVPKTWRIEQGLLDDFQAEVSKYPMRESEVVANLLRLYISIKGED